MMMHLPSWVALALSVARVASALPYAADSSIHVPLVRSRSLANERGVVESGLVASEVARLKSKYAQTLANYERNVGTKHPLDTTHLLSRRATGEVSLESQQQNALWTGTISFGTPKQDISIDFDTGSGDVVVNPSAYTPSKSSTQEETGYGFKESYDDGTKAQGDIYTDKLTIGGVSADKAYIGRADKAFIKDNGNSQGIAGMGFKNLCKFVFHKPFTYSLFDAGALDEHAFTFKLREKGSTLILGQSDPNAAWVPLTAASYWSVDAKVNDQNVTAIVDSGTALIVAPTKTAKSLFKSLGLKYTDQDGTLTAEYDCASEPKVDITVGSTTVSLAGVLSAGTTRSGQCQLAIVGEDVGLDDSVILGDPFFRKTTISFDVTNERVGFA